MTNERFKQTYYGAIDLQSHELFVQPYNKGESSSTIAFLKYLQEQYPQSRIALIWDGAQRERADVVLRRLEGLRLRIIVLEKSRVIFILLIKTQRLTNGKLLVFDLRRSADAQIVVLRRLAKRELCAPPNKIPLKMFGCQQNVLYANFILFVLHLRRAASPLGRSPKDYLN